ncbi:MAG TPA: DUF1801 domain-containing protein [Pseudolysinimonas sp.]
MISDPRVDAYIAAMPAWMAELAEQARQAIREADAELEETIQRTDRPYFVRSGTVAAFQATKDHLNVFLYDPDVADPAGLINQGEGNATARSIQLFEGDRVDAAALRALIAEICRRNFAGGWRALRENH